MCQAPRKIQALDGSWILAWHFAKVFSGSWILSTQFLWDPVDLGSYLEKLLLDSRDPGSCSEEINLRRMAFRRRIFFFFFGHGTCLTERAAVVGI